MLRRAGIRAAAGARPFRRPGVRALSGAPGGSSVSAAAPAQALLDVAGPPEVPSWSVEELLASPTGAEPPEVSDAELDRLAELACLKIPQEERAKVREDLRGILRCIDHVREVDVEGVEPMYSPLQDKVTLRLRPDEVTEGGDAEQVLANAAKRSGAYFVVPRVIAGDSRDTGASADVPP
eukprot:tig00000615_g2577.t1